MYTYKICIFKIKLWITGLSWVYENKIMSNNNYILDS